MANAKWQCYATPGAANPKQMNMTTCLHPSQSFFSSHPTQIAICKSCMHASDHVKPAGPLFILKLAGSKNPQQVKLNYTKGLCTIHKSEPFFFLIVAVCREAELFLEQVEWVVLMCLLPLSFLSTMGNWCVLTFRKRSRQGFVGDVR